MKSKKLLNEIDRNRELMGLSPINEAYEDLPKIVDTYPNVTFHKRTTNDRLPKNLLDDIQDAAKKADITISVNYARTDHDKYTKSGNISRHWQGWAVDLSTVDGHGWSSKSSAQKKGIYDGIEKFVAILKSKGYKVNSEKGNDKAVLYFGFPYHDNHIHVSNKSGQPSPAGDENPNVPSTTDSDDEDDVPTTTDSDDEDATDSEEDNIPFWDIRGKLKQKGKQITQKIVDYINNFDIPDFDK